LHRTLVFRPRVTQYVFIELIQSRGLRPCRGLCIRPIPFLAYCLQVTLKQRLLLHAPGFTPTAVLEKLAEIKMIDVWIPTVDQRWLILPRYTQPSVDTKVLIEKLKLQLPSQPPPRLVGQKQSYEIEVPIIP
jgi:hypothetical protein